MDEGHLLWRNASVQPPTQAALDKYQVKPQNFGPNEKRIHSRNSRCAFRATFNNPSHYKGWSKGHSQEKKGKILVIYGDLVILSSCYPLFNWLFPKIKVPQNGWFISWKTLLKWMIWGVKTPIFGNTQLLPLLLSHLNLLPLDVLGARRPAKRIIECLHQARTESHSAMASNGHLSFGG